MSDRAPDLTQALIGFRAWRPDASGHLHPWSWSRTGAWVPGVNTAVCEVASHQAPAAGCACGLYALASSLDRRLDAPGQVVGAIAAWGEVEVHRTGFRAEHAAIVALAGSHPAAARAATRHGVALVPRPGLAEAAAAFGAPLDPSFLPAPGPAPRRASRAARPPRAPSARARAVRRVGSVGVALDEHVWVRPTAADVEVGLTAPFAELLGTSPEVVTLPAGSDVAAGDVLAHVTTSAGEGFVVWSLVSGVLAETTTSLLPGGRLARVLDAEWALDQTRFAWGRRAEVLYAAQLGRAAQGHDVWEAVRPTWVLVRDASDVLDELRRWRTRPRFATGDEWYAACAPRVHERLAADPGAAARAGRAEVLVRVRALDVDAELVLDAHAGEVRVSRGPAARHADLTLEADAHVAAGLFDRTLDTARALRAGELRSDQPLPRTLGVLSVLKHVL